MGGKSKPHPPLYATWSAMITRCHNPNHQSYQFYGRRGITVCDRWRASFAAFLEDMAPRPSKGHTLDRIDNEKGYEPSNVRWATRIEQMANRRCTIIVEYEGREVPLAEACRLSGIPYASAFSRHYRGFSWEDHRDRRPQERSHCPSGHAYTPENTFLHKRKGGNPFRRCKACERKRQARRVRPSKRARNDHPKGAGRAQQAAR